MGQLLSDIFLVVLNGLSVGLIFVEVVVMLTWFLGFGKGSTCCGMDELFDHTAYGLSQMQEEVSAI